MTLLAVAVALVLLLAAGFHLAWALGLWIPIRDEATLARTVVGAKGIEKMPGAVPCALVAVALVFTASLPFTPHFPFQPLLLLGAGFVFLARGAATYVPAFRKLAPEPEFTRLDTRVFGPLCLGLGFCLMLLFYETR